MLIQLQEYSGQDIGKGSQSGTGGVRLAQFSGLERNGQVGMRRTCGNRVFCLLADFRRI